MRAVNLIPDDQRGGGAIAARSGGAAYLVLGLLAGLAILAGLYGISHHQLESRRAEAVSLTAQALQVQQQAARLAPYTTFLAMREQRMQAVQELVGSRFDWSNAMGELSRVLPGDVALTAIQGTIGSTNAVAKAPAAAGSAAAGSATVASATPPGTTPSVTLSGCAASQSVVAQTLVRLRLVEGVSSVVLASSTKSSSGSAGSSSGACPGTDPVFSIQVDFSPLPSMSAVSAAASAGSGAASAGSGGSPAGSGAASAGGSGVTGGKAR